MKKAYKKKGQSWGLKEIEVHLKNDVRSIENMTNN